MSGVLAHSPAEVIRALMVQNGLGTSPPVVGQPPLPWPVFVGTEPNAPDNCLTVYDTEDVDDGRLQTDGERQYHHGVQVRVRSITQTVGYVQGNLVGTGFDAVLAENVTIGVNTYTVYAISRTSGVTYIGTDSPSTKRSLHTLNAKVAVRKIK